MNKIILFTFAVLYSININAQLGTAHDFTVTDLDGNEISLYANILDEGIVAIVDVSATWCEPCWSLHQSHVLQEMHEQFGPDGTNQVRVIYYEGDATTTLDDLQGTGSNTFGNWLEGTTYPVINETPLSLNLNVYAPFGFPTVNVIRPSDREIVADPYNIYVFEDFLAAVNTALDGEVVFEVVSNTDDVTNDVSLSVFPNPSSNVVTLTLEGFDRLTNIEVFSILGRKITSRQVNSNETVLDFSNLETGTYILRATSGGLQQTTQVHVVK